MRRREIIFSFLIYIYLNIARWSTSLVSRLQLNPLNARLTAKFTDARSKRVSSIFVMNGGSNVACHHKGFNNPRNLNVQTFQDSLKLYNDIMNCKDPYICDALKSSMDAYKSALRLYGPERLIVSYNGGKDAVVIMHLHRAAIAKYSNDIGTIHQARAIYFHNPEEFREVRELVQKTAKEFDLDLLEFEEGFVEGLARCIDENGPGSFGFILGTRLGDPNCGEQSIFTPSSDWMPPFMRVNPIIKWNYGQVWKFLKSFNLPYPKLYDEGYTSLGNISDTSKNPALRKRKLDCEHFQFVGEDEYYPAYMLSDWGLERAGRGVRSVSTLGCELKSNIYAIPNRIRDARTAGIIIIGDEILKGKCEDTNTLFAAKRLHEKGISLRRVAIVCDNMDDITAEVRNQESICLVRSYAIQSLDLVITSGGLGPTHDDVTIHAVASALGQRIMENELMVAKIRRNLNLSSDQQLSKAQMKLAMLPELARLRTAPSDASGWPILQCENVFILPGVPQFFEKKLSVIVDHFLSGNPIHVAKLVLCIDEFEIVSQLDEAVLKYSSVTFGSYPFVGPEHGAKTIITLESHDPTEINAAADFLQKIIPQDFILEYIPNDDSLTASTRGR